MTAPMIDVQGHLLLPTLYPLANQAVTFGREWCIDSCTTRVLRIRSSVLRGQIAHGLCERAVDPRSNFPYAPANLWHKLSRTDFEAFLPRAAVAGFATAAPHRRPPRSSRSRRMLIDAARFRRRSAPATGSSRAARSRLRAWASGLADVRRRNTARRSTKAHARRPMQAATGGADQRRSVVSARLSGGDRTGGREGANRSRSARRPAVSVLPKGLRRLFAPDRRRRRGLPADFEQATRTGSIEDPGVVIAAREVECRRGLSRAFPQGDEGGADLASCGYRAAVRKRRGAVRLRRATPPTTGSSPCATPMPTLKARIAGRAVRHAS